jgi:3-dehydroquinate dehydratase
MEAMREAWTDRRLDGLSHKVDEFEGRVGIQFERVDARFDMLEQRVDQSFEHIDERFDLMEARFDRFEGRFDAYQRATLQMTAVVIAALIGFIATQV